MENNEILSWYKTFYKEQKWNVSLHVFLTIFIIPVEIIIFSVFTRYFFICLYNKNFKEFSKLFIYFIISLAFLQLLYGWKSYIDTELVPKIQIFVRKSYFNRILDYTSDKVNNAQIMNQITIMPQFFYQNYDIIIKFWIPFLFSFFFFSCFVCWYNLKLGILTFVFSGIIVTAFIFSFKAILKIAKDFFKKDEETLSSYENILINNETLKNFQTKKNELEGLEVEEEEIAEHRKKIVFYTSVFEYGFLILCIGFMVILFFIFYKKMIAKQIPSWKFVTFISIMLFIIRQFISVTSTLLRTLYQTSSLTNIEFLEKNYPPIKKETVNVDTIENFDIELKNVDFGYGDKMILKDISIRVPFQHNLLIKGPIGSGKSTIAKLIMQWNQPQRGEIKLGSMLLKNIPEKLFHKNFYYMTQNTVLLSNKTVLENIFYKKPVKREELKQFDLPESFLKILDKVVIKQGINISGGSKRLIHLLRSFFHNGKILILDEPTDNLDENTTQTVIKLIQKLQQTKTVICISHDSRIDKIFDRICYVTNKN